MKSPTALAYLFGNPLSFLAILGATLFVGYEALTGQASGWLAVILIVVFGFSLKCQNYLSSYGRWKREWDAMNGQPPQSSAFAGMSWLRHPVGVIAWIFGAIMAWAAGSHPYEQWAGNVFWLVSLIGMAATAFRAVKRLMSGAMHSNKTIAVAVCLPTPLLSVRASETCNVLPEYCLRTLGR